MIIENKEMLLYSMNKAYDELVKVLNSPDEKEVYFRFGSCLHWVIDCYDRLPHKREEQEMAWFFEALRGANNCLKHNRMLRKLEKAVGRKTYPSKYPNAYGVYYLWENIEKMKGMKHCQQKAYQEMLYEKKISDSMKKAIIHVNKCYEKWGK